MNINLTNDQLSLIRNALGALAENCEYENKATVCEEIHEANSETITDVEELIQYIELRMKGQGRNAETLPPHIAIEVKDGLVQSVYADADVSVSVFDLDVSDFPDEGEAEAADELEAELNDVVNAPGWRRVW